jgi:hypothetical protein
MRLFAAVMRFYKLSLIVDGITEKVSQFIMLLKF